MEFLYSAGSIWARRTLAFFASRASFLAFLAACFPSSACSSFRASRLRMRLSNEPGTMPAMVTAASSVLGATKVLSPVCTAAGWPKSCFASVAVCHRSSVLLFRPGSSLYIHCFVQNNTPGIWRGGWPSCCRSSLNVDSTRKCFRRQSSSSAMLSARRDSENGRWRNGGSEKGRRDRGSGDGEKRRWRRRKAKMARKGDDGER
jgi:hypothetical protein